MVVMDPSYQKLSDQVGDTTVNTWYLASESQEAVKKNHEAGIKALSYFSKVYGPYPYPEYDIVRTGMFTAMEFPGLVYLPKLTPESDGVEIGSVVHETAHQWWYAMVGNDEVKEPWLDEAMATYSTTRFMLEEYPEHGAGDLELRRHMTIGTEVHERGGLFIGSSVDKFKNIGTYSQLVYQKGALMLENLEKVIGKEKMDQLLQNYFRKYQYEMATGSDFIAVFSEELGPEAKEYFENWLNGKEPEFKK
jgi:aminopeptidase N